jgi:hypothetical protein
MSIWLMSEVWKRYPAGGSELNLALALADHAHDDGTHIWPKVQSLARKIRKSERATQRLLRTMEESGWLVLINAGDGGRGKSREYAVHPDWINGAVLDPGKVAVKVDITASPLEVPERVTFLAETVTLPTQRVTSAVLKGDVAASPASNHHQPSRQPSCNRQEGAVPLPVSSVIREDEQVELIRQEPVVAVPKPLPTAKSSKGKKAFDARAHLISRGVDPQVADDWLTQRKKKNLEPTETAMVGVEAEAVKAGISLHDAVKEACLRGWASFKAPWLERDGPKGGAGRAQAVKLTRQEQIDVQNAETRRKLAVKFSVGRSTTPAAGMLSDANTIEMGSRP